MIESIVSKMFVTAGEAALEAGWMLVSRLRTDFQISKKGRINLVTEMDLQVEKMIVDRIREDFPKHKILAEERGNEAGGTVSRLDGSGCTIYDGGIVATNGRIDGVLVEQLTQCIVPN